MEEQTVSIASCTCGAERRRAEGSGAADGEQLEGFGMTQEERQWHWAEGNKYATECMKGVLLNGGGALALLSFFGSRPRVLSSVATEAIGNALFSFGIGTIRSVMVFLCAYLTQLHYGNEGTEIRPGRQGVIWHNLAYGAVGIAVGGFIVGIWFARRAVIAALT